MDERALRESVYRANMALTDHGLVIFTWGNVSAVDRERDLLYIKPSGVAYAELSPDNMVPVSLASGEVLDGSYKPSSDTDTHRVLYRAFEGAGGVVHTHSLFATAHAQARTPIPCMGTTHADYFHGDIPCTRPLTEDETGRRYEAETGAVIVETFSGRDPLQVPAVLVANHGPFSWGKDANQAVHNAVVMEYLAQMNSHARSLNPEASRPPHYLIDRHYLRKHGNDAYYGQ